MTRLLDLLITLVLAPLWVPIAAIVALVALMTNGRPIFFVDERAGRDGMPFRMFKFRTMRNGPGTDGDRITKTGKILRKLSLDEIPQLWHVLTGKMSLVGPRPLPVRYLPRYSAFEMRRHEVRPGITGWAQVNGRNTLDWETKFRYDVWYVDHRSVGLYLKILVLTAKKILDFSSINHPKYDTMVEMPDKMHVLVVGAGGLGHEVAWTLHRLDLDFLGFADDDLTREGVLGTPEAVAGEYPDAAVVIAIGDNATREKMRARLGAREYPAIIDPAAIVASNAKVGKGVFVGPLAVVSDKATIGEFSIVNARSGVGHDCTVGAFASVSPGVSLSGFTELGNGVFMGTNSCTLPGVRIGAGAKIAAGMPVYSDVAAEATLSPFGVFRKTSVHNKEQ